MKQREGNKLYFITAITDIEEEKVGIKCFGYFSELEEAEKAVVHNKFDMWETIYNYIVIEKIKEGIHSIAEEIGWYKYNEKKGGFIKIDYTNISFCNCAIG